MQLKRFACGLEVKLAPDSDTESMTFEGYGAVFGNVDAYGDVIVKGAFKETLREAKKARQLPAMLLQHGGWGLDSESMTPIGIWTEMAEDDYGLKVSGKLADTVRGRDAYTLLKMGAINGLSIGFQVKEFVLGTKPEEPRRTIKKIELHEVSLVTFPANPKARVEAVKAIYEISSLADAERYLRDACGLSRQEAVTFVSRVKGFDPSDSDGLDEVAAALKERGRRLGLN